MADLLNIGTTGLLAYQSSLATVSHNIANVNTEGYRRQRVDLVAQVPQLSGAGFEGSGVRVSSLQRVYDRFLEGQVTSNMSTFKQQETLSSLSGELNNYLADPNIGLSPVLQGFFKSVQDLSTDPSSAPVRQVMLSDAETLASVFNDTYRRLQDSKNSVNTQLASSVTEINNLSSAIANVNKNILLTSNGSENFPPNDLLDQRQTLINKLAELVNVTTVSQDDGSVNVFIGNGQSLVVGAISQKLAITQNEFDQTQNEIGFVTGGSVSPITNQLTGGKIGGALSFRNDVLSVAYNTIGRVALGLSNDINDQHQLGYDLNNQLGGNFFTDLTSTTAISNINNATSTDYQLVSNVTDSNLVQASDYRLDYSSAGGGTFSLTRLSDNSIVGSSTSLATLSSTVSASEGFSITLSSGTSITAGDSFLISPVRNATRDIGVAITNTNQIAAASPLIFTRSASNGGDAFINEGSLISRSGSTIPATPVTLTFNSATNEFAVSTGGTISYDPASDSGTQHQVVIAGLGTYQFTVKGNPANGDVFSLGSNAGGVADNRNLLAIINLQESKQLANGSANYQEAYSELVSQVGVKTKRAEFSRDAHQALFERAQASQQEVSGVNLDEEAANLIRFQQAYQAVARVISTADELFQTLLGAVSR